MIYSTHSLSTVLMHEEIALQELPDTITFIYRNK